MEVSEAKLTNYLGDNVHPALIDESAPLITGFIGPYQLITEQCIILYDQSLRGINSLVCGGNQPDYHYTGFNVLRDIGEVNYLDLSKIIEGGICPHCGKPSITLSRGIEVGNIFQLGIKYSKAMEMQYLDKNGDLHYPIMGCYGIGVGRLAASVCEAHHDDYGPIWPITIAPWQVHLCCIRADDTQTKEYADHLYDELQREHIEVIYDDRDVRAGVMFSDADLLGVPIRVIVSPRNLQENCVELVTRDKTVNEKVEQTQVMSTVKELIHLMLKQYL
jgi:prolyl-tRNA synthetase